MTGTDWQRILRIMDEVYAGYVSGMAAIAEARRGRSDPQVE
jgi:hypothetical protein